MQNHFKINYRLDICQTLNKINLHCWSTRGQAHDYKYQGDYFFCQVQMIWQHIFLVMKIYFWLILTLKTLTLWGHGLLQGFPDRLITLGFYVLWPVYPDPQKTKINTRDHQDLVENSQKLALKNPYFLRLLLSLCLGHCLVLFKVCDMF